MKKSLLAAAIAMLLGPVGHASADLPVDSSQDVTAPQVSSMTANPLAVDFTDGSSRTELALRWSSPR